MKIWMAIVVAAVSLGGCVAVPVYSGPAADPGYYYGPPAATYYGPPAATFSFGYRNYGGYRYRGWR